MKLSLRAFSIAVILATGVLAVGCNKKEEAKAPAAAQQQMPPTVVDVEIVELSNVPLMQTFAGRVAAIETSEVRPQVSGIVETVLFKEGSQVKKGQELYRINADNYVSAANTSLAAIATAEASLVSAKASLTAQEATLAQARADLARVQGLISIDAVSKQLVDQYRTAVKTAEANVAAARATVDQANASINSAKAAHDASRLDMSRTVVRAPISGKISISSVTAGALVSASQATPLATISRTDAVFVDIQQPSSDLLKLRQQLAQGKASQGSAEVQIVLEDGTPYPLIGQLALSDAKVEQSTGAITLRAVFPNPNAILIPGMYVNANLIQTVANNAVLLPQSAVTLTPKGDAQVYVVNAEKKIEVRDIKTSGTFKGKWVVTEGLVTGDAVVVMGGAKVKPDQAVEVRVLPAGGQPESQAQESQDPQAQQAPQDPEVQAQAQQPQQAPNQSPAQGQVAQNSVMAPPNQAATPNSSSQTPDSDSKEAEEMADAADESY